MQAVNKETIASFFKMKNTVIQGSSNVIGPLDVLNTMFVHTQTETTTQNIRLRVFPNLYRTHLEMLA